jgi:hypothetical protein
MARKVLLNPNNFEQYTVDAEMYTFRTNNSFCKWLIKHEDFIAIAHNMKGYDGAFILQYFLNNFRGDDTMPTCLITGTKTLSITHRKLKIIDSYSFLPMALEKFSSTFNIKEVKKGFFPHKFNIESNYNYVGPYPEKSFYGSELFNAKKKQEFDAWYETVKNTEFNFQTELQAYCWSDVELLTQVCLEFRKHIIEQTKLSDTDTGIDPFQSSITLASLSNYIYRRNFMDENTIGIIPENGYNCKIKTSVKCQVWLKHLMEKNNIHIEHANNGGEKQFGKHFVDGYHADTNTILEFDGCYWHGCEDCFTGHTFNNTKKQTMFCLRQSTAKRIDELKQLNPTATIIQMKECTFDKLAKEDPELRAFIERNPIKPKLLPRDSLFGGRTEAIKLYYSCQGNFLYNYLLFLLIAKNNKL